MVDSIEEVQQLLGRLTPSHAEESKFARQHRSDVLGRFGTLEKQSQLAVEESCFLWTTVMCIQCQPLENHGEESTG